MKSRNRLILAVLFTSLLGLLPALAQEGYEFMPKGGKALLIQRLGDPADSAELRRIALAQRSALEWSDVLAARTGPMSNEELQTLASYLAVNMPLSEGALELAEQQGAVTAALPPDGRELAWNHCQFCHSLFTGYLTHDR
ncbi:MAG: hypothetical protein ACYSUI_19365, partial [Planctomycetota bacterium]